MSHESSNPYYRGRPVDDFEQALFTNWLRKQAPDLQEAIYRASLSATPPPPTYRGHPVDDLVELHDGSWGRP